MHRLRYNEVMILPIDSEIIALHHSQASTPAMFDKVYLHCQIVWAIAEQLIEQNDLQVDKDLVRVGCLIHDIGVYGLFSDINILKPGVSYITHGVEGEAVLQQAGWDAALQRFASHHTGVGLTKEMIIAENLPLPRQDFLAETAEERLVMYADKFHSKDTQPCFNSFEWYEQKLAQFGGDTTTRFHNLAEEFGKPDLAPLAEQYGHPIR